MTVRWFAGLMLVLAGAMAQASPLGPDGNPGRRLPGKFVWFDLAADDPAAARAFYGAVFGWRFREAAGARGSYLLIEHADGKVGGLFRQARPAGATAGARWLSLISVGDPHKAAQYVRNQGGQVIVGPVEVPGRGTHAIFRDPQGAVFGVLASSDGDPADDPVPDGEIFWVDLFARDPQRAAAFYAGLAGYEVSREEAAGSRRRLTLATGGFARAGIWALPANASAPGWLPYVLVDDVPATLARARSAGGRVLLEPRAELLGGNLAVIADPSGGVIGVVNWSERAERLGATR